MDTIGNMLTSIRNAQTAGRQTVYIPYSKTKMRIAEILAKEGFIKEAASKGKKSRKFIEITLAYLEDSSPRISHIARVSKLSKRVYLPSKKIYPVMKGLGMQIFSTPKGILTDKEARKEKVGGEVICEVW